MTKILILVLFTIKAFSTSAQVEVVSKGNVQNDVLAFKDCIVYFLAPTCKLCISKAVDIEATINDIKLNKQSTSVYFIFHQNILLKHQIKFVKNFKKNTKNLVHINDKNNELAQQFNVDVTPTVLLFNKEGNIIYEGALDDKDISLNETKYQKSVSYIDLALDQYWLGQSILINKTKSIGCIFR